jgi:DNA-3-methyladenine glycosylase
MKQFDLDSPKPLAEKFYLQNTLSVAKALLGKGLLVRHSDAILLVEIVEVEAYLGNQDPASHAYRGRTLRNWPMFERGGTCYVYLSYGMHYCMNVVTGPAGKGEAVLLRGALPIKGVSIMARNRGVRSETKLLTGPGKFTQALGIDISFNGRCFNDRDFCIINLGRKFLHHQLCISTRIGISKATNLPFRFFLRDSAGVSKRKAR